MKKIFAYILLSFSFTMLLIGQQMPVVSQFSRNIVYLDPGATGNKEALAASFFFRKQWVNISGSPLTQAVSIHAPLKDPKVAMGVLMEHENKGALNLTSVYINYAYRLMIGPGKLSLGLRLGMNTGSENFIELQDPADPLFNTATVKFAGPNAGLGAYYHTSTYWAGFSIPRLLTYNQISANEYKMDYDAKQFEYFFAGGYKIPVNSDISVESSGLIILSKYYRSSVAVNALATYKGNYKAGLGYRTNDEAIIVLIGYKLNNQFSLGYSYDLSVGRLWGYTSGSHEINLSYKFGYTVNASSPRRF